MKSEIEQEIKKIKISDLHLWSENPRDPIDSDIGDLEIIKRAIKNDNKKWNITKLIKEMGQYYDLSELPTIVFEKNKYFVYDGNRRIAIIKYLQNPNWAHKIEGKLFPSSEPVLLKNLSEIPCNVCDKSTALINIERKHVNNGTWKQLERDYFQHHFRGKEKSLFLKFEESTGLISQYPQLNENIMKNNILTEKKLKEIGFSFDKNNNLTSVYDKNTAKKILDKLADLKIEKVISSRDGEKYKKYDIKSPLQDVPELKGKIKRFEEKEAQKVNYTKDTSESQQRKTPITKEGPLKLFGGSTLILENGEVNNIYSDIKSLYGYYEQKKNYLSRTFPAIIRMALRLLVETAAGGFGKIDSYILKNFDNAKKNLTQDEKNTLSGNSVTKEKMVELLQTGAHNYTNSVNINQTLAMSLIIGKMLEITHKKQ
jgi:hypothetical protein